MVKLSEIKNLDESWDELINGLLKTLKDKDWELNRISKYFAEALVRPFFGDSDEKYEIVYNLFQDYEKEYKELKQEDISKMKEEKYTDKEGNEKVVYKLELGDVFKVDDFNIREGNYGLYGYIYTGDKTIKLTSGQCAFFNRQKVRKGDWIEAYEYENKHGKFVGIRLKYDSSKKEAKPHKTEVVSKPAKQDSDKKEDIPEVDGREVYEKTEDYLIGLLVYDERFKPWKDYLIAHENDRTVFYNVIKRLQDYAETSLTVLPGSERLVSLMNKFNLARAEEEYKKDKKGE